MLPGAISSQRKKILRLIPEKREIQQYVKLKFHSICVMRVHHPEEDVGRMMPKASKLYRKRMDGMFDPEGVAEINANNLEI